MKPIADMFKEFFAGKPKPPMDGEVSSADPYHLFFGGQTSMMQYNPSELVSRKGYSIYDKMRKDDQVKAAMAFKKQSAIASGWTIMPPEGMAEDAEPVEFVKGVLDKLDGTFKRNLLEILTALDYGFSVSELVFEERDLQIALKAVKTRRPHEWEFEVDGGGNLTKLKQSSKDMPVDKFVVYSYGYEFSNHYGNSDLEAAYRPWWGKDNAYKWLAILLEKHGIPPIFALYDPNDYAGDRLKKLKQVLVGLQASTSALIPRANKDGIEFWAPELARNVQEAFIPAIDNYNQSISRALLMPGLIGMTADAEQGSLARAEVHFDAFMLVLDFIRSDLEELINEQIVIPLCALNYPLEECPKFKLNPLTDDVRMDILEAWSKLVGVKVVKQQAEDEKHIRELLKFPERDAADEDYEPEPPPQPPTDKPPLTEQQFTELLARTFDYGL